MGGRRVGIADERAEIPRQERGRSRTAELIVQPEPICLPFSVSLAPMQGNARSRTKVRTRRGHEAGQGRGRFGIDGRHSRRRSNRQKSPGASTTVLAPSSDRFHTSSIAGLFRGHVRGTAAPASSTQTTAHRPCEKRDSHGRWYAPALSQTTRSPSPDRIGQRRRGAAGRRSCRSGRRGSSGPERRPCR